MNISIIAEPIFHINQFVVTNSLMTVWLIMLFLTIISLIIFKNIKKTPSGLQNVIELILELLYDLVEKVEKQKAKRYFPIIATFFIFILLNNWAGLLPGVGSIGILEKEEGHEKLIPFFRAGTSDLNTTFALAIISVISIQYFGIKALGLKIYLSKFFNFKGPIDFVVGILELIGEFTKILSFAFRLFGNIFAGEVLLTIIVFLIPVFASIPFLALEIFVGLIQALVFAMLSLVFISVATQAHEEKH